MNKAVGLERQDTAVGFLRVVQPLRFLKRQGLCEETRILPFSGDMTMQKFQWNDRLLMQIGHWADIFLCDMVWRDEDFLKLLDLRKWSGAKVIIDMDDNMLAVTRDNPAYKGVQDVWPKMQRSLQFADGVTVSVPSLKELYAPLNKNIFINPNGVDFSWWSQFSVKKHKGIRIGWRGAAGHKYDQNLVIPAMRALTKDYPGTVFVVFQQLDPKFDFPYEWQPYVPYFGKEDPQDPSKHDPDYPEILAKLNLDIGVVPLVDSSYNRCKSNLAYQEFSSLRIPTVLSPVENQRHMTARYAITNHEWYDQLADLITHEAARHELGQAAYDHVYQNYNMEKLIYPFAEWAEKLKRRTDYDDPEAFFLQEKATT